VEFKELVGEVAALLKPIIETVDKFGLKARFLRRHKIDVDRFFKRLSRRDCQSGTSLRCKQRLEKNRDTLFTFLDHDDVPAATAAREPPKGARCDSSPRNLRAPAATAAREPQFRPAPRCDFEIPRWNLMTLQTTWIIHHRNWQRSPSPQVKDGCL
jgi:hypothetical protein